MKWKEMVRALMALNLRMFQYLRMRFCNGFRAALVASMSIARLVMAGTPNGFSRNFHRTRA